MNSNKIWSFLLLISIVFSFSHDFAFVFLDKGQYSVEEYVDDFSNVIIEENSTQSTSIHNVHNEYHTIIDVCQAKIISFFETQKIKNIFQKARIFYSWESFNLLKPPIA